MNDEAVITTDAVDELPADVAKINEITAAALLDERRIAAREAEATRLAALEEISPTCRAVTIDLADPMVRLQVETLVAGSMIALREEDLPASVRVPCEHKLNRHDPCSECPCRGFVSAAGEDAQAAAAALREKHPDLFPSEPPHD